MKKIIVLFLILLSLAVVLVMADDEVQRVRDWRTNPSMIMAPQDWRFVYDFNQQPQESYILRPAGVGVVNSWTDFPDSADNYQAIREVVANGDLSYLYSPTVGQKDLWVTDACPNIIVDSLANYLTVRKNGSGLASIKTGIWKIVGSTWYGLDTIDLSSTYTQARISYPLNPVTGSQWLYSQINGSLSTTNWGIENVSITSSIRDTIGWTTGADMASLGAQYCDAIIALADFTGTIDSLAVNLYSTYSSYLKLALYSDTTINSIHHPNKLMDSTNIFNISSAGWKIFPINSTDGNGLNTNIIFGTNYWIAVRHLVSLPVKYKKSGQTNGHNYIANSWSDPWSQNVPSGWTVNANMINLMGAGNTPIPDNRITQSYLQVYYHSGGTVPMVQTVYKPPIQAIYSAGKRFIYR